MTKKECRYYIIKKNVKKQSYYSNYKRIVFAIENP